MKKLKYTIITLLFAFIMNINTIAEINMDCVTDSTITTKEDAKKIAISSENYIQPYIKNYDEYSENSIVIYHTNDGHGYLKGDNENIVGIDKVAVLKDNTPNSLLVDAGDATQGLPIASITKGEDVIDLMNMADYDIMVTGNHEFDYGKEQLISNVKKAEFTVLAANVYDGDKKLLDGVQNGSSGCHKIIEIDGVKIGFFGIITSQTTTATNPEGIKGLEFRNEIEYAKKEIDELNSENADVIIGVCHLGNLDAPCSSTELAQAMTGKYQGELDAIIDGHSHTVENTVENDVLIAQTGSAMSAVGKLTIDINNNDFEIKEELITPKDLAEVEADSTISAKIDEISANQEKLLSSKIGTAETTLWSGWIGDIGISRFVETNYGDFAADAFKTAGEEFMKNDGNDIPVVAVENGGGIREALPNGVITEGNLISTFPFSNTLYLKEITPAILYDMMEVSGGLLDGIDPKTGMLLQQKISGGFLQISGFNVVFNPDSKDKKVVSITLDGESEPLDRNDNRKSIMLVSNNFIMNGGNDYTMLNELPKYGEIGGEVETIKAYLLSCLENGKLMGYDGIKNRIIMQGGYKPVPYTVNIKITDEKGGAMPDKTLSYRIDGGKRMNGITNSEGILVIKVNDGPHGIRLSDNQNEIYVNNYAGLGITEDSLRSYPVLEFISDGSCDAIEESTETTTNSQERGSSGAGMKKEHTTVVTTEEISTEETTHIANDKAVFSDIENHWAENIIENMAETGTITGYIDGSFKPDNSITRAEFITMLYRNGLYDLQYETSSIPFTDVSKNKWYYDYAMWGFATGIINGYNDNSFKGDNNITREEMAVILSKFMKLICNESENNSVIFADNESISYWAKEYVNNISAYGIVKGDNNNYFMPDKNMTRAEAAVVINQISEYMNS